MEVTDGAAIGYAALNTRLPSPNHTFRLSRYSEELMLETATANVEALAAIVRWNAENGIEVFRVGSGLIPFGSHPINRHRWQRVLGDRLADIGATARANTDAALHAPGPVHRAERAARKRACRLRRGPQLPCHRAGAPRWRAGLAHRAALRRRYGDKTAALSRLEQRYGQLPERLRMRLAFENDENVCNAEDVLHFCARVGAPAVLDVFHHAVHPSMPGKISGS